MWMGIITKTRLQIVHLSTTAISENDINQVNSCEVIGWGLPYAQCVAALTV